MILNDLESVIDLYNEKVCLFSGDEIIRHNYLGNFDNFNIDNKVDCNFCEVIEISCGVVNGVSDEPTLNILLKE